MFARLKTKWGSHKRDLLLFWKYVLLSMFHFGRYNSKKVIMLRLDLLGDCTMFSSAAVAIRRFFSNREMTLVCLSSAKPLYERLGIFNNIIVVDFKPHDVNYDKLRVLLRLLRTEQYDILLQPQLSKYPLADILAAAIKCNTRIAIETKAGNSPAKWVRMTNFLYEKIPYPREALSEFDYYGAFVRGLGISNYKTTRPNIPYKEQHFVEGNYYVLYPGGSLSQKFWPSERFARIADHIYEQTGLIGVILGVAEEQWVSDRLIANLKPQTTMSMIDLTGKTSVTDVIDIIGNASLVVSNDTSGVHIACATNTPSVATVGGWLFRRFLPYHIEDVNVDDNLPLVAFSEMPCFYCNWEWGIVGERNPECLEHLKRGEPSSCISGISYEQVQLLVDKVIDSINGLNIVSNGE